MLWWWTVLISVFTVINSALTINSVNLCVLTTYITLAHSLSPKHCHQTTCHPCHPISVNFKLCHTQHVTYMTPHFVQNTDLSPITHHSYIVTWNLSPTWHPTLYNTQPATHNLSLTHCHPRSVIHITPHLVQHKHVTHNQFTHMLSHKTVSQTTHHPTSPHLYEPQTQMSCHVSCPPRACCRSHRVAVWGWCRCWWSHSIAPKPPHWSASGECLASCLAWSTGRLYWTRTMQITNIQIFSRTQRSRRKRLVLLIGRSRGLPNRKN